MGSNALNKIESLPSSPDSLAGATANSFGGFSEAEIRSGKPAPAVEGYGSEVALDGLTSTGACGRPFGFER